MSNLLEQSMRDICAAHDLHNISVAICTEFGARATVHWNGFSRDGISCASTPGDTINDAVANVIAEARIKRTPDDAAAVLADVAIEQVLA